MCIIPTLQVGKQQTFSQVKENVKQFSLELGYLVPSRFLPYDADTQQASLVGTPALATRLWAI